MEPPVLNYIEPIRCLQGLAYASLLVGSSFFGTHFFLMPLMPLAVFWPSLFRRMVDFLVGYWLVLPSALMELWFGVQLFVRGDKIDRDKPAIIIMNHRTRLDWLFFWNALWRMDPWLLTTEKISLKRMLKFVPGAGWAMSTNAFMFLDRSFASDQARIDAMISYYKRSNGTYQLLLFPEGTDKCPLATARSRKYAETNQLVHYNHVLQPRTLGFAYLLQRMRKEQYIEHIYDVTVGYEECIIQTEAELILRGLTPRKVHFLVRKIPISMLPDDDAQVEEWLKAKWAEKEDVLRKFYTIGEFSGGDHSKLQNFELSARGRQLQFTVLFVWLALTVLWTYIFFYIFSPMIRWGSALFTVAFFVGMQVYGGGFEMVLARLTLQQNGTKEAAVSPFKKSELNNNINGTTNGKKYG